MFNTLCLSFAVDTTINVHSSTQTNVCYVCYLACRHWCLTHLTHCDVMCQHRFGSALAYVMACFLIAESHFLNFSSVCFSGIHQRAISQ